MCQTPPFRADHVGSFLRPQELIEAREAFASGKISQEDLTQVEDQAILDLVKKQQELGIENITDGEFRRSYWHLDFFWGLNGVEHVQAAEGYHFHDETTKADSALLSGKISGEGHPFVAHYKFLRDAVSDRGGVARLTIPAPSQFYFELIRDQEHAENLAQFYPDFDQVVEAIKSAYLTVLEDLYQEGLRAIQVDDCTWGVLVDDNFLTAWGRGEKSKEEVRSELAQQFLTLNNAFYDAVPEDVTVTSHVCRGNFHSTWASSGGYGPIAKELLGDENVDAYYLEYDTDRAGDFEPLKALTPGKKVVLGLITSKFGQLEDKEAVIARIKEAAQYVPLENLCLSPQCGFASTEEGNILTEEEQWAKLKLVQEIAQEVWG
ncbi:5-methyltetrahydropteroyltriglutamate--homocysteine S-methyltransferase [Streptococcus ovuberis]|uniref:5-methyltetrahydropteroyltriglutamate--homocysteine S-methyltransferase n=1 Tax=Streptococcus ovuberis TaxID=1936207 RepID=A0A7X6MZL9_9STRE|nr:5-methyltetrahydropteroyltriglutamate--homocysteine S-methyltransferase [Streptococcus ovuberis]NKZ19314.1 5-methyltetrahydropteroyltriglutamate--homocysteine S-methyltransferase [Streptococcus ovuberis]